MPLRSAKLILALLVFSSTNLEAGPRLHKGSIGVSCAYRIQRALVKNTQATVRRLNARVGIPSDAGLIRHIKFMLRNGWIRNLAKDPLTSAYLSQHKVYVSLSTTPQRIGQVIHVLETLDLTHVENILIALPEVFERDGSRYQIPPELLSFPKVKIIEAKRDYGPATKLIPAIEWVGEKDPQSLVITVDDDTGYPIGMVNDFIYSAAHFPNAVCGRIGNDMSNWNIEPIAPNLAEIKGSLDGFVEARAIDVLEGYGAIAYRPALVDTALIETWIDSCPQCRLSDDLVISLALAQKGVPRVRIQSLFYNYFFQYNFGFHDDALHLGGDAVESVEPGKNMHNLRYPQVFQHLREHLNFLSVP